MILLYLIQNSYKYVTAFYSASMPEVASQYSNSELELWGLKKSLLYFHYLLKYSTLTVLMDHCVLTRIYIIKKACQDSPYSEIFRGNIRFFIWFWAYLW